MTRVQSQYLYFQSSWRSSSLQISWRSSKNVGVPLYGVRRTHSKKFLIICKSLGRITVGTMACGCKYEDWTWNFLCTSPSLLYFNNLYICTINHPPHPRPRYFLLRARVLVHPLLTTYLSTTLQATCQATIRLKIFLLVSSTRSALRSLLILFYPRLERDALTMKTVPG